MIVRRSAFLALVAACLTAALVTAKARAQADGDAPPIPAEQFAKLHALVKPAGGEAKWATVPWMPAADLWAARRKAAGEGKPMLLWYMAGEPLGTC